MTATKKPLRSVRYDERFKLPGDEMIWHLVEFSCTRIMNGALHVELAPICGPSRWLDWNTEVELA